jgi:hypothetical protein
MNECHRPPFTSDGMQTENETMNKILIAAGVLVAATSAAWAQDYYAPNTYSYSDPPGYGVYDYAPGYGYAPGFGPYSYGGGNGYDYDRVDQPGRGNSAESTR